MQWGKKSIAWPTLSSRGLLRAFATAMGVAGAAFGSPLAALAQTAGVSSPAPPVASAPAAPLSHADKLIAADLLFKRLLLKPDDLDAGFRYAELETELGDYEAAIGALERMLYYNPNLPR